VASFTHVPGTPGCCRGLAGIFVPATLVGFTFPSQCCSDPRVRSSFDISNPPAVSPLRPPRVSSSRSTPAKACRWAFGRGFWVTVRGSAVPCFSPAPPWLVCTGSLELTSQDCPGFYFLSQVFDAGRRSPPLEPFRPWTFDRTARHCCSVTSRCSNVPFGVLSSRHLAAPVVFPSGSASCLRFSRRPQNVHRLWPAHSIHG